MFSNKLNDNMRNCAVEGSYASVIGGGPAAAIVFPKQVRKRALGDDRLKAFAEKVQKSKSVEKNRLQIEYEELFNEVFAEKQAEFSAEFDAVHNVQRAKRVGSIDEIISSDNVRQYVISVLSEEMTS